MGEATPYDAARIYEFHRRRLQPSFRSFPRSGILEESKLWKHYVRMVESVNNTDIKLSEFIHMQFLAGKYLPQHMYGKKAEEIATSWTEEEPK